MKLEEQLYDVKRVAIAGHVKPDGDCVGSTLAVYNYIRKYHPEMEVELHLEPIPNIFKFLANADRQLLYRKRAIRFIYCIGLRR